MLLPGGVGRRPDRLGGARRSCCLSSAPIAALRAGKLVPMLPAWQPVGSVGDQFHAIRPHRRSAFGLPIDVSLASHRFGRFEEGVPCVRRDGKGAVP